MLLEIQRPWKNPCVLSKIKHFLSILIVSDPKRFSCPAHLHKFVHGRYCELHGEGFFLFHQHRT
uniref:Uncharacterized protein n=1 Tax=Rhizophora mucronata TaxID=61149 RepID=A0A2P2QRD2_RHIMU